MPLTKEQLSTFQKDALSAHNRYRAKHGVGPLRLNDDLSKHAQGWAEHMAREDKLQHSGKQCGENVAMFYSSQTTEYTGQQVTDQWYSEISKYNFGSNGFQSGTGHFTQVVWKASTEMGIGKAVTAKGKVYVTANYIPAGNMAGGYQGNVFPPRAGASVEDAQKPPAKTDADRAETGIALVGNFQKEALLVHNEYRSKHGVDSLRLSGELCKSAQDWADYLAKTGRFEHSKRTDIGENVAMHYSSATTQYSGKEASDQWYRELSKYDFKKPGFGSGTGHFTQMVWKDSKEFGIGKAVTKDGKVMVVGQYRPPGNITGRYEANVFPRPDGYTPPPSGGQASKVTRVVRTTKYVTEESPEDVTRKVGGMKLEDADLSPSDLGTFQQDALKAHNKYRARHGAGSLTHSEDLARRAQDWAAHLAKNNEFKNSSNSDVGENIAMHYSSASTAFSGEEATDMFYRQNTKYNFKEPKFTSGAGHFTQLVWKDTKEFGIGKGITKEGKVIVVAFYNPPGNVMGKFDSQVSEAGK